ncbi:ankyrin [Colletotrichum somersetense]|nr:ankyrin [Colletotrichum somersetense]
MPTINSLHNTDMTISTFSEGLVSGKIIAQSSSPPLTPSLTTMPRSPASVAATTLMNWADTQPLRADGPPNTSHSSRLFNGSHFFQQQCSRRMAQLPDHSSMEMPTLASQNDEMYHASVNMAHDRVPSSETVRPIQGSPLHVAAALGHVAVAKTLILHGANINSVDKSGLTPIHYATLNSQNAMVKLLAEHGADIDCRDSQGYSPLYRASETGNEGVVELLLRNGAILE